MKLGLQIWPAELLIDVVSYTNVTVTSCEIRKLLLNFKFLSVGVQVVHKPRRRRPSVEGGHKWEVGLETLHRWYAIDLVIKKADEKALLHQLAILEKIVTK